jgi:hypothetical protein
MIPLIYFIIVVAHAYIDSKKIKKGIRIRHKTELYFYALVSFVLFWALAELTAAPIVSLILFPLLTRAAFFDPVLNFLIGKHFLFEGVEKKKSDTSFWDNLEKSIGMPTVVYRIIYFVLYIIHLFYYFIWSLN